MSIFLPKATYKAGHMIIHELGIQMTRPQAVFSVLWQRVFYQWQRGWTINHWVFNHQGWRIDSKFGIPQIDKSHGVGKSIDKSMVCLMRWPWIWQIWQLFETTPSASEKCEKWWTHNFQWTWHCLEGAVLYDVFCLCQPLVGWIGSISPHCHCWVGLSP